MISTKLQSKAGELGWMLAVIFLFIIHIHQSYVYLFMNPL